MRKSMRLTYMMLLTGCVFSEQSTHLLERADSAGVEVIAVLRPPADTIRLDQPSVRIGSPGMGGSEQEAFQLISDLVLLSDERVAIVDNRGARVAVFDESGAWHFDIGGRGEGPGEYTAPMYASGRSDTLFVWDAIQRRLLRFTATGTFLGSTAMPDRSSSHPFAAIAGGYVMEVESGQLMDPAPARGALVRVRRDGTPADTLVSSYPVPESGWLVTNEGTGDGHMVNPPALAIYPPWTVADERLIRLDPTAATVEVRSLETGSIERVVRLPYEAASPTASERDAYFRALQAEFGLPDEIIARERAATKFVDVRPPLAGILADDRGRLWLAEHDPSAPGQHYIGAGWDAVDLVQEYARHVRFPQGFELKAVQRGRAYGVTTLDNGVQVVDVFLLREGNS